MTDPTTPAPLDLLEDDDSFEETANPGAPSSGDFEDFDIPAPMVGLVRGHVSEVKPNPRDAKVLIIELKSEEPETSGNTVGVFIKLDDPRQRARLCTLAASVGLVVAPIPGGRGMRIQGGTKAMKNKPCIFVVETYSKDDGTVEASVAWGMPKPEKSAEWKEYAEAYNNGSGFTEEQVKAIKAGGGIIPVDKQGLFN